MTLKLGDRAKRNDNGRIVRVTDIRPIGMRVFYVIEDVHDGHTAIIAERDLRPAPPAPRKDD